MSLFSEITTTKPGMVCFDRKESEFFWCFKRLGFLKFKKVFSRKHYSSIEKGKLCSSPLPSKIISDSDYGVDWIYIQLFWRFYWKNC